MSEFTTMNMQDQELNSLNGIKVMVVDDSKTILRSAELYLKEKEGCEVLTVQDGFEALSAIADFSPDLIFMDIMMPRLDGYQACALIKSNPEYADIPVVMLSSKHSLFDKARGRLSGSDEYLTKPFTHDDLIQTIITHTSGEDHSKHGTNEPQHDLPEFV